MVMRITTNACATIETDGNLIDVVELTSFLYFFRAAYAAALERFPQHVTRSELNEDGINHLCKELRHHLVDTHWQSISGLARKDLGNKNLYIRDIHRENPINIVFEGIPIALAVAIILSGGRIKILGTLDVKLPPLGTGIRSLREAFGKKPQKPRERQLKKEQ